MKLDNDFDDYGNGKMTTTAFAISMGVILLIIIVVLSVNKNRFTKPKTFNSVSSSVSDSVEEENTDILSDPYKDITVADLDFYGMYDEPVSEELEVGDAGLSKEREKEKAEENETKEETDITKDGKHIKIVYENGKEEWVSISPYLLKNDYDYTNLINQNGFMKYFEDGRETSYLGVDISKENDYVDFVKLYKAGVDYCMVKVGQRGYQTGDITEDDYYKDNIKRAFDAGMDVGVIFTSFAITEEEAVEEANWLMDKLGGYVISYPVVLSMESVNNDSARTDEMNKADRTKIARAFLSRIKECGYKPMLLANKEWLLKRYDLSKLISEYDFWLSEPEADYPDYPYKYSMWRYTETGSVDGIKGNCNLNISFVDYSIR